MIEEITARELDAERFISEKVEEIRDAVGDGTAKLDALRKAFTR